MSAQAAIDVRRLQSKVFIETDRLRLRQWQADDTPVYLALNQDPEVMTYLRGPRPRHLSRQHIDEYAAEIDRLGFGNFATERRDTGAFIGFVGISEMPKALPFAPAVEIGWRLARAHWGRGFATEGAQACLQFGFQTIGLDRIVAYTSAINQPSRHVMEKIGMALVAGADFEHPQIDPADPACRHVLYEVCR